MESRYESTARVYSWSGHVRTQHTESLNGESVHVLPAVHLGVRAGYARLRGHRGRPVGGQGYKYGKKAKKLRIRIANRIFIGIICPTKSVRHVTSGN